MSSYRKMKPQFMVLIFVLVAIICLIIALFCNNQVFKSFLSNIRFSQQRCGGSQGVFAFYNVDNADASFVYTNNEIGLIDTGLTETSGVLVREIERFNTNTLDFVVISHPHDDHASGYLELIKTITVKKLFIGQYSQNNFKNIFLYNEIIRVSNEKDIEVIYVTHGLNVKIGGIQLLFFDTPKSSTEENNNSLLVKVTVGNTDCLYTGDAGESVEKFLLSLECNLKADILKVGHHGSTTASSSEFLRAVMPKYSVVCVGYNEYGHPHQDTIERLKNVDTTVYRTDICEKILFQVHENAIDVVVE